MAQRRFVREGAEFGRGLGFFDAIFGFAITLLVVNIEPPPAEAWASLSTLLDHGFGTKLLGFAISFVWLGKIGAGPGTDPVETIIGRFLTAYYFLFFLTMPVWTKLDKTKPVPERVTTHD